MQLQGSKTEQNLKAAFASETAARCKYEFYSDKARQDGYEQIADIFQQTSDQESEHAEIWLKYLGAQAGSTQDNLKGAIDTEDYETSSLYPEYARIAREEGFGEIADSFDMVGEVERMHEERFKKLLENLSGGAVFSRDGDTVWICRKCGHIHIGKSAPETCPVCSHPQSFFELKAENY